MTYPPPPWTLQGFSLQTLHLLEIDRVRPFIPADLKIFPVLPGKTLGGVYIASYGEGSTLHYNELIVVSGLIAQSGKVGSWISHIYVDHSDSIAGGRNIWGLPKQMARFNWKGTDQVSVQLEQDDRAICVMRREWQLPGWSQPLAAPVFSLLDRKLLCFEARAKLQVQIAGLVLSIPSDSPLIDLGLGKPWLGAYAKDLHCVVEAPEVLQSV